MRFIQNIIIFLLSLIISSQIATLATTLPTNFNQLPTEEQQTLKQDKIIIQEDNQQITGKFIIKTPLEIAWQVLTDYNNFNKFIPSVAESRVLEDKGDHKVFEQISVVKIFLLEQKAKIKIAVTETYPKNIDFKVVEGELNTLSGFWHLEPLNPQKNEILITHQSNSNLDPNSGDYIFFDFYKDGLLANLTAIKQEAEKRGKIKL